MRAFTYWHGKCPPYIDHCIYTISARCNYPLVVLNEESARRAIAGVGLHENVWKLERIAQIADCLRVALLYKYGGMWVDADTVCIGNFDRIHDLMAHHKVAFVTDDKTGIPYNGYLAACQGSDYMREWLDKINKKLKNMVTTADYTTKFHLFGCDIMQELKDISHGDIPMNWLFPFNFSNGNGKIFSENEDIQKYISPETCAIALSNSWLSSRPDGAYDRPVKEIAGYSNLMGSIMRYSLELDK